MLKYRQDMSENTHVDFFKDKKVLIVEDDAFLGGIVAESLHKNKATVNLVTSAENAIEYLKSTVPDIVVLDIFLPGMNGFTFLEDFRKNPLTAKVPVLVLSNSGQAEDRERVKNLGADFMAKALVTPNEAIDHLYQMLVKRQIH